METQHFEGAIKQRNNERKVEGEQNDGGKLEKMTEDVERET